MNQQTLDKMKKMKLYGMYRNFSQVLDNTDATALSADELLSQLIEAEWDDRNNRAVDRSLRNARFRYKSSIDMIDFAPHRQLDKNQLHRLAEGTFIRQHQCLIITGSTGTDGPAGSGDYIGLHHGLQGIVRQYHPPTEST